MDHLDLWIRDIYTLYINCVHVCMAFNLETFLAILEKSTSVMDSDSELSQGYYAGETIKLY